jgi:hypothetical protein
MSASDADEEENLEELHERATQGDIDLDEIMVFCCYASENAEQVLRKELDDESSTDDDMSASDADEEENLEELYERAAQGDIDLDEIMVFC